MSKFILPRLAVSLILISALVVGCQDSDQSTRASTTATRDEPAAASFASIPGQFPVPSTTTQAGQNEASVGSCVKITGTIWQAGIEQADCGGAEATHRIIQRVTTPDQCVTDVDRRFYQNTANGEWTACLDIYWTTSDCLSITDTGTRRVSCSDQSAPTRVRATNLVVGATTLDACKSGGYAHPARRFTICTETQN
ncbi:Putative liporotein LppU [Mycobacteroides abscessus subsp. abscessus]|uniref:LppU/SCO3897 family protein n=1 Tax=Mycobacteroides abscessus TaxID=36809 RepID=UPI00092942AD|nr:Putative liporotein LppU [Mycobacteroides abscessus subsp. abscessus]SHS99092.1 Putative liporotein LppU [Mycobacteroides abscessus subsp. abscessus]SHT07175.1 Putative liporotein LppU [Mycobacteroides abscessus subsp. abscessus]SHT75314.1 Putative liporotein LppU [Mycobacteroides abscessus subsp. abscessus]SHT94381.1 Putative liporotein LppU [Mycobacteroides abscessus subsp. abscessus]